MACLRIAVLQPSISIVLHQLGCLDQIVACTKYCQAAVPELAASSAQVIHDSWSCKTDEILAVRPNLVLASVPYRMETLAAILKTGLPVLALAPHSLADIYSELALLGNIVGKASAAHAIVENMQQQIEAIRLRAQTATRRPLVYCEEWGKPLIHSQPWVDELVKAAGGQTFAKAGMTTVAETIRTADPDVMIFAWCGAGDRVPLEKVIRDRGWNDLGAVRAGRVFCVPDEWLNTPAPTLLHGLRALAAALHPQIFPDFHPPRRIAAICHAPISE